jgi:hypothetical protein
VLVLGLLGSAAMACTVSQPVLLVVDATPDGYIDPPDANALDASALTDCTAALELGQTLLGVTCDLDCERRSPLDPCTMEFVDCAPDGLHYSTQNTCGLACDGDQACTPGASVCNDEICEVCPLAEACPECPEGLEPLQRSGCTTCTCAPVTECDSDDDCAPSTCVRGAACSPGCPADDLQCCTSTCVPTDAACPGPVPRGCLVACDDEHPGCDQCATRDCTCDGDTWTCTQVCADGIELTCAFP